MMEKISSVRRAHPAAIVVGFAVASSLLRLWLARNYFGFQTGDDLEVAEEAFRRATGLVHSPWSVRSLFIPDILVTPLVYAATRMGVRDALTLAGIARWPFILLSGVNIFLVFMLGRRWYGDRAGVIAAGLYAFHWMPLVYGSSLFPRTVAVTCILSSALALNEEGSAARVFLAGFLAAIAVTARYSEAIYFGSLFIVLIPADQSNRRRAMSALTTGFLTGVVIFVGFYDRITWGRWFGSLRDFAELTFIREDASSAGVVQPPWWYLANLPHWMPLTLLAGVVAAVCRNDRRRAIAFVIFPVLVLSAIFHKELRYLQVVVPFVVLIGTQGILTSWGGQSHGRRVAALLLAAALPLGWTHAGFAAKRSTNAVTAARWIATCRPTAVALSQAWAYGGRLFLGNEPSITDVGVPPDMMQIGRMQASVSALAVYSDDADQGLRRRCAANGLSEVTVFDSHGGHSVTVFSRRQ